MELGLNLNISFICSKGREFRAECIQAHLPKFVNSTIITVDAQKNTKITLLVKMLSLIWPIWKKNYLVFIVSADMLEFVSFYSRCAKVVCNRTIIDFYDIFGIRTNNNSEAYKKYKYYESVIFNKNKLFFARSFELNKYRKQLAPNGRKFLFIPDYYPQINKPTEYDVSHKYAINRIVFLGNFSLEYMAKIDKLGSDFEVDVFLWHGISPKQMEEKCRNSNVTIRFQKSIKVEAFDEVLSRYHFGIILISENSNVYEYSAAIKYMSYIKAGTHVITDPRHRISRWYARYFRNKLLFVDDRELQTLSAKKLNEFVSEHNTIDNAVRMERENCICLNLSSKFSKNLERFLYDS